MRGPADGMLVTTSNPRRRRRDPCPFAVDLLDAAMDLTEWISHRGAIALLLCMGLFFRLAGARAGKEGGEHRRIASNWASRINPPSTIRLPAPPVTIGINRPSTQPRQIYRCFWRFPPWICWFSSSWGWRWLACAWSWWRCPAPANPRTGSVTNRNFGRFRRFWPQCKARIRSNPLDITALSAERLIPSVMGRSWI